MIPSRSQLMNCAQISGAIRPTKTAIRVLQVSLAIAALSTVSMPEASATEQARSDLLNPDIRNNPSDSHWVHLATHEDATAHNELVILAQAEGGQRPPPGGGQGPDLSQVAAELGVSEDALRDALGAPPPDFAQAAQKLGISEDRLRSVMPPPRSRQ